MEKSRKRAEIWGYFNLVPSIKGEFTAVPDSFGYSFRIRSDFAKRFETRIDEVEMYFYQDKFIFIKRLQESRNFRRGLLVFENIFTIEKPRNNNANNYKSVREIRMQMSSLKTF